MESQTPSIQVVFAMSVRIRQSQRGLGYPPRHPLTDVTSQQFGTDKTVWHGHAGRDRVHGYSCLNSSDELASGRSSPGRPPHFGNLGKSMGASSAGGTCNPSRSGAMYAKRPRHHPGRTKPKFLNHEFGEPLRENLDTIAEHTAASQHHGKPTDFQAIAAKLRTRLARRQKTLHGAPNPLPIPRHYGNTPTRGWGFFFPPSPFFSPPKKPPRGGVGGKNPPPQKGGVFFFFFFFFPLPPQKKTDSNSRAKTPPCPFSATFSETMRTFLHVNRASGFDCVAIRPRFSTFTRFLGHRPRFLQPHPESSSPTSAR